MRYALTLASIGVAVGLAAAIGLTGLMKSLLFGISPMDSDVCRRSGRLGLGGGARQLSAGARASSVDPVEALKAE